MCVCSKFNVGTLNIRGCKDPYDRSILAKDVLRYDLQILGVQETHLKHQNNQGFENIVALLDLPKRSRTYNFFYCGSDKNTHHGVGLLINSALNPTFNRISDRICSAKIQLKSRCLYVICGYAPTLTKSEENPKLRDDFYAELDQAVSNISRRHVVVVLGDFNAKTGSGFREFPTNMGPFGKGLINENGRYLLEFAARNKCVLTNTLFKHKPAHVTTWTAPERKDQHRSWDGTIRRNPYRNQIDYIMVRSKDRYMVQNSRSYNGITTKIQIINLSLPTWNLNGGRNNQTQNLNHTFKIYDEVKDFKDNQEQWTHLVSSCHQAGKEILGEVPRSVKHQDKTLEELSEKQRKTKEDIEKCQSKETRSELRKDRNNTIKLIRKRIQVIEDQELNHKLEEIEKHKDDSRRCFIAIKELNRKKKKIPLTVFTQDGSVAGSEEEQVKSITAHFTKMFTKEVKENIDPIPPSKMEKPFTHSEIEKAAKSMKNGKSVGEDKLNAEYVKYGPTAIHQGIADILNNIAETGKHPKEIKSGILTPLPKPGKKQGPPSNLRPIILLSTMRKILAICMIKRCWNRFKTKIPLEQAAYQEGRSTTEHVLAVKLLCEKAITSCDYNLYMKLLDMSKAFDTVSRMKLLNDLKHLLEPDEYHMLSIIILDVRLKVRVGDQEGEEIIIEVGIAQGDCLGAILFILYLAITLNNLLSFPQNIMTIPTMCHRRTILIQSSPLNIKTTTTMCHRKITSLSILNTLMTSPTLPPAKKETRK